MLLSDIDDESYRGTISVLGSCHGLLLINIVKHGYLWNPATRFHDKEWRINFDYKE